MAERVSAAVVRIDPTAAERQKRVREKMRDAGLISCTVWVPKGRQGAIQQLAKQLRDNEGRMK